MSDAPSAHVVVESPRKWFGDQRLGTFTVSLDHTKVGKLPPKGRLELLCPAGSHVVRIRQWWFRSRPLQIIASEERPVVLIADAVRGGNLFARMGVFGFSPGRALTLVEK